MKPYLPILFTLPIVANAAVLKSPDGSLQIDVNVKDKHLVYSITHTNGPIMKSSQMGVLIDGKDLGTAAKLGEETNYTVDESYAWRGVKSLVQNKGNGKRIAIQQGKMTVTFRKHQTLLNQRSSLKNTPNAPAHALRL